MRTFVTLVGIAVLGAACADGPESPLAPSPHVRAPNADAGSTAFLLLPEPGSASRAFGLMAVAVGVDVPPNPCLPRATPPRGPVLSFCAAVLNPGFETLKSGSFTLAGTGREPALVPFRLSLPPSPCLVLQVAGTLTLSVEVTPGPPTVGATLVTSAGTLGGGTEQNPGPPTIGSRARFPIGGAALACTVTATAG